MVGELSFEERWRLVHDSEKYSLGFFDYVVQTSTHEVIEHNEWCIRFCEGKYTTWGTDDGEEFQFSLESDAVAFKLRWS